MKEKRLLIINQLKKFSRRPKINGISPSIVKTLLAALDLLFLTEYYPPERENPNSLKFYIKEEIAEAVSYIIYLKHKIYGFQNSDSFLVDEDYIVSNELENILLPACHLKALQEFEIMIDHYSYICVRKKNHIRIKPPYPEIEKSIRIGYIRSDLQKGYDFKEFKHITSFEEVCDKFLKLPNLDVFKYVEDNNYPRYRIEVPEPVFKALSDYFFKPKEIFREEAQYLTIIFKEQFLDYEKLNEIKISKNLSLLEFFILKRLFEFFYHIFSKKVSDRLKEEYKIVIRSLIPTFDKEKLAKFYEGIVEEDAFNEFLDIVTWNPRENSVFDVQYQPFLKTNEAYMVPVCTFVHSNSIRNVFASEYRTGNPSIMDDGKYDPTSELLQKAFEAKNFKTFKRITHSFKQGGEIDFLSYKDNFLFIAECKKFLHPTNIYEQRTIYDGLNKASSQLDLIIEVLKDDKAVAQISSRIGVDISKFKTIRTAIVTNTRLFCGLSLNNHPIRNVYELVNFIESGNFRAEDGYYWLWENNYFTLSDLEKYLDDNLPIFKGLYNAMLPMQMKYEFGKYELTFETFVLNIEKAKNSIRDLGLRKVEVTDGTIL